MKFDLLNPITHTSLISFNTIPQIIIYLKNLNLPSSEQFTIFPSHNSKTSIFFVFTLNQLITTYKNNPSELK